MVGDLVPNDNPVWSFFLNFLEIVDILLSNQIKNNCLRVNIEFFLAESRIIRSRV